MPVPHPHQRLLWRNKNHVYDLRFTRQWLWRMASSGMLRRVVLVRTDVSKELSASFIRVTRIGELRTTLATANVPSSSILVTLMMEALSSFETSVLTRSKRRNIPEGAIPYKPVTLPVQRWRERLHLRGNVNNKVYCRCPKLWRVRPGRYKNLLSSASCPGRPVVHPNCFEGFIP
jgi:hypothetical protein